MGYTTDAMLAQGPTPLAKERLFHVTEGILLAKVACDTQDTHIYTYRIVSCTGESGLHEGPIRGRLPHQFSLLLAFRRLYGIHTRTHLHARA